MGAETPRIVLSSADGEPNSAIAERLARTKATLGNMHLIPSHISWLNQVERFFVLITDKAIRRDSFTSVKQPVQRIDRFVTAYNENCTPFE